MSNMTQYTEIQPCAIEDNVKTYVVRLKVGSQLFTLEPSLPLDDAKWMQEQLTVALERIVKERRGDLIW